MRRKKDKTQAVVEILTAIKKGTKFSKSNAILAPLSQADLIQYDTPPKGWPAENVRLTEGGEVFLKVNKAKATRKP